MIVFEKLTIRNFLSFGNVDQTVGLHNGTLSLIIGENLDTPSQNGSSRNGVGKSTVINALCYALYGNSLSTIKKDNLINITNEKNMQVALEFSVDNSKYKIVRGRKPNIFQFFINNKEQKHGIDEAQGENRETQDEIDKIIGISYEMFKQIVGFNTTTASFLNLSAKDQRDVIEELMGVTILSHKAEVLKDNLKNTKEAILAEEVRIKTASQSNDRVNKSIVEMQNRSNCWETTRIQEINSLVDALEQLQHINIDKEIDLINKKTHIKQITDTLTVVRKDIVYNDRLLNTERMVLTQTQQFLDDLDKNICQTCGQTIHDEKKQALLEQQYFLQQKTVDRIKQLENENIKLLEQQEQLKNGLISIDDSYKPFYSTIEQVYDHKTQIEVLINYLDTKEKEQNPYPNSMIDQQKELLQSIDSSYLDSLYLLKTHQEFVLKLLTNKDSFVRKAIIEQNLSYLNTRLQWYLVKIGLPHKVKFLSDLSVSITNFGRELDWGNLSRGEQTRLMLGLSFSFRDVFESLNKAINLLFVDELLDQGLDSGGLNATIELLQTMSREHKRDVFIVSHHEELHSKIQNIITIVKQNGFSSLK